MELFLFIITSLNWFNSPLSKLKENVDDPYFERYSMFMESHICSSCVRQLTDRQSNSSFVYEHDVGEFDCTHMNNEDDNDYYGKYFQ